MLNLDSIICFADFAYKDNRVRELVKANSNPDCLTASEVEANESKLTEFAKTYADSIGVTFREVAALKEAYLLVQLKVEKKISSFSRQAVTKHIQASPFIDFGD